MEGGRRIESSYIITFATYVMHAIWCHKGYIFKGDMFLMQNYHRIAAIIIY